MLGVATLEIGNPVAVVVLMEGDDFAREVHGKRITQRRKDAEEWKETTEKEAAQKRL